MEREKQKKAENERLERERKEALLKKSLGGPETITVSHFDGNGYEEPQKSKFVRILLFYFFNFNSETYFQKEGGLETYIELFK